MSGGDKTPDATETERALAEVAVSRINRYKQVFAPLENKLFREIYRIREPGQYDEVAGQASAAVEGEFGAAERDMTRTMSARGVDPSSGAFAGGSRALSKAKERALATGVAGAQVDNTDRFYEGVEGIVAMGQGQARDAVEGLGAVASRSNDAARIQARTAFDKATGVREVAGTAVGAAAGYGANR